VQAWVLLMRGGESRIIGQWRAADVEQLETLEERLLRADSWADLLNGSE
jgi:hypothetical protein